ncbi:unnamed protein product [Sphagnum jensenii]|uniref:Homeobox domain-containing protein n=1 Tax=Sphagnum jensenii TaxID=128206 RepID=A0ABP0WCH5_9BRYO
MASNDSSPVQSPENQKGIVRRKKSPLQLGLLEKTYAEDKYPSDAVRAELSKKIGLSEKQLRVWFTHRRHKDRRDGIDDDKLTLHGNRIKADTDSDELPSTKRGEIDLNSREDDRSEDGYPAAVLAEEQDDDVLIVKKMNGVNVDDSSYEEIEKPKATTKRKSASSLKESKKPPRNPSSPKSKPISKPESFELAAIRAVESQLNGPLREDGPPLGFEFDSPPPGAFEELTSAEVPYVANVRSDNGYQSLSGRAALEGKWGKDSMLLEKKKRKVGDLYSARLPAGQSVYRGII